MESRVEFQKRLELALKLDLPHSERLLRLRDGVPTPAAVLALFGWKKGNEFEPHLLLIKRTESVETHKGQMAFPGGHIDPTDRDPVDAALREMQEEVGIARGNIEVLGALPDLLTITGYQITPIVGILMTPIEDMTLNLCEHEIAEAIWIPYSQLTSPVVYQKEKWKTDGPNGNQEFTIHVYQLGPYRVWGATGSLVRNLLRRMGVE